MVRTIGAVVGTVALPFAGVDGRVVGVADGWVVVGDEPPVDPEDECLVAPVPWEGPRGTEVVDVVALCRAGTVVPVTEVAAIAALAS